MRSGQAACGKFLCALPASTASNVAKILRNSAESGLILFPTVGTSFRIFFMMKTKLAFVSLLATVSLALSACGGVADEAKDSDAKETTRSESSESQKDSDKDSEKETEKSEQEAPAKRESSSDGSSDMMDILKQQFMASCEKETTPEGACECTWQAIDDRYTLEDLMAFATDPNGQQKMMEEIAPDVFKCAAEALK